MIRRMLTRTLPGACSGRGSRGIDRFQRPKHVRSERVDRARHRRVRRHVAEHTRLFPQQRDISQTVTTQRQRKRQVEHDLGRIVPGRRLAPRRQRRRQRIAQPDPADRFQQQHTTGLRHRPGPSRVDPDSRVKPTTLHHLTGAPGIAASGGFATPILAGLEHLSCHQRAITRESTGLALGLGTMTFERVTDPTPHPCASGDTAHIAIVHSAVGQSGCLVVDQYTLRVLGYVDVEAPCDPSSQTMIPSSAPLFTVQGADARWLGQWATQHPNAELVLMIDWTAVGVFKMAQTHVKYPTTTLAGYTVQSQMACGISTVTSRAGRPDALASGYTVH